MPILIVNSKAERLPLVDEERNAGTIVYVEPDDNQVLGRLRREAVAYCKDDNGGRQLECTIVFADASSLWQVLNLGLPDELMEKADVMVTTREDLMAKTLLLGLPGIVSPCTPLDRIPQGFVSDRTVHMVIFGCGAMAEALAVNAAMVAHYPNYCRDSRLRTRITIVDNEVFALRDRMLLRYRHLFEHSYYRTIDLDDTAPQCVLHHPMYEGRRKDFVDVEWEFVRGNAGSQVVRLKLSEWAGLDTQQLTVAVCGGDYGENAVIAHTLPEELQVCNIPVFFQTSVESQFNYEDNRTIVPFSDGLCHISMLGTLEKMAIMVNYVYNYCYSLDKETSVAAPPFIDVAEAQRQWTQLTSFGKRYSCVMNAMTLGLKMHSVGVGHEEWDSYQALTKEEIEILSEVEHNRWSVEELMIGYRPVNDREQAAVEQDISLKRELRNRKIHYDLRAFEDLRRDISGKNAAVYDRALVQGIPLILKTCITD